MRSASKVRAAVLSATLACLVLVSACGNRNSYEALRAAAAVPATGQAAVAPANGTPATAVQASAVQTGTAAAVPGPASGGGGPAVAPATGRSAGVVPAGSPASTGAAAARPAAASPTARTGAAAAGSGPTAKAGGATTAGAAGSAPAACTAQKSTVVLGSVGEQSGLAGASLADGPRVVAAWVASVNAAGGLYCHPLKYVIADDGGDPSQNQALAQQLVEQDHVIAFVHNDGALAESGSEQYLASHKIPVIGSEGGAQFFYEHPNFFPQIASGHNLVANSVGVGVALPPGMQQHMAIISCIEAKECSQFGQLSPDYAKPLGLNYIYNGQASITSSDYSSQCLSAQKAGGLSFSLLMDANSVFRVIRSCDAVGYHPQYIIAGPSVVPALTTVPSLNGAIIASTAMPWMITGNSSVNRYNEVMRRFAPGVPSDPSGFTGWVSAQLFATAVKSLSDNPTSAEILDDMYTIKNNDLGGITQPLTFTAGQNAPQNPVCWWTIKIVDGHWTSPDNGKRTCHSF
jgi:branched-chain amino acid transport system substrate-binding protein